MAAVAGVMQVDGALLGVARPYRATFGDEHVEYLPALGRNAKAPAPWRLQLQTIRRGERVLLDGATDHAERRHDRRSVTWHRPGVDERYDVRPDGIEQSFHFAAVPPGDGDLVVDVRVTTDLAPTAGPRLSWRNGQGGGVTLGAVTGIDGSGRRCAGSARLTAGGFELRLPADFVATATAPLVLDPLIGTASEALAGADCDFPDVAYDAFTDTWCVAWTQFFASNSTGVVGSVFAARDLAFQYAFAVNQPGDEDSVRVANIGGTGLFVMAWVNRTSAGARISGLAFDPGRAQATNVFTVWGPGSCGQVVLSSEATTFDDDCLFAWIDDTYGLLGCTVAIDAQWRPSGSQVVQIAGGHPTEPAFSKQGGNPGLHVLTWVDRPPGLPGWIRAQVVDDELNALGPGAWLHQGGQDAGWPAVDGDGFLFLAAWEEQEVANPSATDIRGRLLTVGPGGITSLGAVLDLVRYPNDLDMQPDVALLGDKFGLCFQAQAPNSPWWDDAYFLMLARNGTPIGTELRLDVTPGTTYRYEHAPRLLGRIAGHPGSGIADGLVVFADQSATTGDSNVGLQPVAAMGAGGVVQDLGLGCGPAGLAVANGPCALGNGSFRCELYGAPPLAVPFLLVGFGGAARQSCGVCTALNAVSSTFAANTAGMVSAPLPLPGAANLLGFTFEFQFALFQVQYVGCPWLPGLAASNIVRATVDY